MCREIQEMHTEGMLRKAVAKNLFEDETYIDIGKQFVDGTGSGQGQ